MHALTLAVLFLATPAAPSRTFDVPGHGQLVLAVPEGWSAEATLRTDAPWPTIALRPPAGRDFSVQISPMFDTGDRLQSAMPPPVARRLAQDALGKLAPRAVEKDLALQDLGGPAPGWFFTATDSAPEPGEWTHATQGVAAVGSFALSFTILTNGADTPERALALELVRSARHVPAPRPGLTPLALRFPGKSWALEVELPGFQSGPVEGTGDGGVTVFATNEKAGLVASVFLEPAEGTGDGAAACAHYLAHRDPVPYDRKSLRRGAHGDLATVEYVVPEYEGMPLRQKNVFACLARDGVWIEIHLSKARFEPTDQAAFDVILKTVRISGADVKRAD